MFLWLCYVGLLSFHANLSHLMNTVLKLRRGCCHRRLGAPTLALLTLLEILTIYGNSFQ